MALPWCIHAFSWSPSSPKATRVTSMSPSANAFSIVSVCDAVSAASKGSMITVAPSRSNRAAAASRRGDGRAARITRSGRRVA
jgi:hypothetical protein